MLTVETVKAVLVVLCAPKMSALVPVSTPSLMIIALKFMRRVPQFLLSLCLFCSHDFNLTTDFAAPPGGACTTPESCGGGSVCLNNVCVCPPTYAAVNGACRPAPAAAGN